MADWPSGIDKPDRVKRIKVKKAHRGTSELGYVQSRSRWTGSKYRFILEWDAMSEDDFDLLDTFFDDNQGLSFTWTHPKTDTEYTCVFSSDEIEFDPVIFTSEYIYYTVSVEIEEQQ